jgi:rRNA maturation endonuclease Nob1
MSELRTVTQQCPHCSKKSELEIYSSINVSLDSSLKKKILDSSLFDWECPHCHEPVEPHRVCKNCGYYDGKQVINKEEAAK